LSWHGRRRQARAKCGEGVRFKCSSVAARGVVCWALRVVRTANRSVCARKKKTTIMVCQRPNAGIGNARVIEASGVAGEWEQRWQVTGALVRHTVLRAFFERCVKEYVVRAVQRRWQRREAGAMMRQKEDRYAGRQQDNSAYEDALRARGRQKEASNRWVAMQKAGGQQPGREAAARGRRRCLRCRLRPGRQKVRDPSPQPAPASCRQNLMPGEQTQRHRDEEAL